METREQHTSSETLASQGVDDSQETSAETAASSNATLEAQLEEQRQKATEYLDHLQRLQAEFQNYRRRVTQEKLDVASRGKEEVLRALLPALANFRLALQHADQDANAVRQGLQMIWQQLEGFLRDQKVEPIPTVGQPFDPAYHEVLSTVPATADTPGNTIVTEVKSGYRFDGRLLSPAQVIVARAAEASGHDLSPAADASTVEVAGS
ncbi:MAG: nucleotide exchange factor GrpE [Candidatus Tectimicrobiota bacterium]